MEVAQAEEGMTMNTTEKARALLDRYTALVETYTEMHPGLPLKAKGFGRRVSIHKKVIDHIAKETGRTSNAVRVDLSIATRTVARADMRELHMQPIPPPQKRGRTPLRARLNPWGIPLDETWVDRIAALDRHLRKCAVWANAIHDELLEIRKSILPMRSAHVGGLARDATVLHHRLVASRPKFLCPYCKGVDSLQPNCVMCENTGYITVGQDNHIPKELRDTKKLMVMVGGQRFKLPQVAVREKIDAVCEEPPQSE